MAVFAKTTQSERTANHGMLVAWGRAIEKTRTGYGLSETAFAACLFVEPGTIVRLERGDPSVSLGIFLNALWALGLNERLDAEFVELDETLAAPDEEVEMTGLSAAVGDGMVGPTRKPDHAGPTDGRETYAARIKLAGDPVCGNDGQDRFVSRGRSQSGRVVRTAVHTVGRWFIRQLVTIWFAQSRVRFPGWMVRRLVDLRFLLAWSIDAGRKGGQALNRSRTWPWASQPASTPVVAISRREKRRQIVCEAVRRARRLQGANANLPPPQRLGGAARSRSMTSQLSA
ncbi:MAG: hypothetical protein JJ902_21450 [Roseibium sp.]|nr:hypothetical protein [Roseibium sp.]